MAPRGRPSIVRGDLDSSFPDSSPDPLNASVNNAKLAAHGKTTRANKTPLTSSSPSKQNRRASVSEPKLELKSPSKSPSKSMVMNTGRAGGASPWRIKVTLEAEPGSGSDENATSPIVQHITRTTTSTIPLKDSDASSPVRRGPGRPRKSEATPGGKQKRSGTPMGKRSRSRGRRSSILPSDPNAADLSGDATPKKRRGRPRKSLVPAATEAPRTREGTAASDVGSTIYVAAAPQDTSQNSNADIDQSLYQPPQQVDPPSGSISDPFGRSEETSKRRRTLTSELDQHAVQTPPQLNASKKPRGRKGTPHAKIVAPAIDISDEDSQMDTPSETDEEAPAPAIVVAEADLHQAEVVDENDAHEETMYALDEGATRMPDDTTIMESENFSMVSVDSLPSGAGLGSPADTPSRLDLMARTMASVLNQSRLQVPPMGTNTNRSSPRQAQASPSQLSKAPPLASAKPSPPVPITRKQTPVMPHRSPSNPPAIQPAPFSPTKAETPRIGRVVKAGVALQGVLDPDRLTPTGQSKEQALDEQRARLDDLFRGFSDGTRRELQAGLRLGEQLARQTQETRVSQLPSAELSSPIKPAVSSSQAEDLFCPRTKHRNSRLLTPEEQDEYTLPVPPPPSAIAEVQYPTLTVDHHDTQLVSPARSEDEMSWRVDTPPVRAESSQASQNRAAYTKRREQAASQKAQMNVKETGKNEYSTLLDDGQCLVPQFPSAARTQTPIGYPDIWQEEASRSSVIDELSQANSAQSPQLPDLFANNGPAKPPRGKLPRTWRRKSSSDFHYSDEAVPEPEQDLSPSSSEESDEMPQPVLDKGKGRLVTPPSEESEELEEAGPTIVIVNKGKGKLVASIIPEEVYEDDHSDQSDESDDTGMFFQANLPNVFNKKRSRELRTQKSDKLDLSLLLSDGDSLLPASSPASYRNPPSSSQSKRTPGEGGSGFATGSSPTSPVKASLRVTPGRGSDSRSRKRERLEHSILLDDEQCVVPEIPSTQTPVDPRRNPFKNTPPQFAAFLASPAKSSPLRQELRASDSEDSYQGPRVDDSTLPVAQSSPFQTIVDESTTSTASDEQQILREMEGRTDSSIRNLRQEADAHAEAYSTQLRSLHEIEEVTEASRTMRSATSILPSSPPQAVDESPPKPQRAYAPLFGASHASFSSANRNPRAEAQPRRLPRGQPRKPREEPRIAVASRASEVSQPQPPSSGLFSRLTTSLWGALGTSARPPMHPVTQQFDPLPKIQPWTKTHYEALDELFQMHKKQQTLFLPSGSALEGTSNSNNALLEHFLEENKKPFLGANYSAWGYQAKMTESLIVLAAVFAQLLTLKDGREYERVTGKKLVLGDCGTYEPGMIIDGEEVIWRLASVMMGEPLRHDEKLGVPIPREEGLCVRWPGEVDYVKL